MSPCGDLDVLQVITRAQRRGAETYAVMLGDALAGRCRTLATAALAPAPAGSPALPVTVLAHDPRSIGAVRALRRAAASASVVIAHGSATLPVTAAATVGGPPFVYRVIGDPAHWAATGARRWRVGRLLRRAAAVAVYVPSAADALVALHGLDRRAVHVIPKGIRVDDWPTTDDAARDDARRSLGITASGAPVLAWIGALQPEKEPLRAVGLLGALPDAHLVVAGDGPLACAVTDTAASLGVTDRITLLGAVDDTRPVLAAADAVVLTSRTEGSPGVLLEAMAAGLPVVASAVGGVPELVDDGVTGRLVGPDSTAAEWADAARWAIGQRDRAGAAARERASVSHDLDRVASQWCDLLRLVAAGR